MFLMQYATAKALLMRDSAGKEHYGPDPVFLFRCQRALQRTDMALWETSTKLDQVGERLEVAFSELYPDKVPEGWEQPVIIETDSAQNAKTARPAAKGRAVKLAATPATSGAPEDEAGVCLPLSVNSHANEVAEACTFATSELIP